MFGGVVNTLFAVLVYCLSHGHARLIALAAGVIMAALSGANWGCVFLVEGAAFLLRGHVMKPSAVVILSPVVGRESARHQ